ncbi:MAG: putative CRISPR-associated protein [Candidatus Scalindua sp.]|nr:putative CRISPR-associated protein [Candidatus Scalindua sp.]
MQKLIITMCGTSALFERSNWKEGGRGRVWGSHEKLISALENEVINKESEEYHYQKERAVKALQENLNRYYENAEKGLNTLSAELASLLAMEKDKEIGPLTPDDKIILFYSDTIDGRLCAETNKEVIEKSEMLKERWKVGGIIKIDELQTKNGAAFVQNGLKSLVNKILQLKDSASNNQLILNITGGYKGTIPILSKLSMDLKVPLIYLFESSHEIIRMDIGGERPSIFTTDSTSGETQSWAIRDLE